MSKESNRSSPEVRKRAVRMVQEHRGEYASLWAAIESIAPKIGCVPQTLHEWVRKQEVDIGLRGWHHQRGTRPRQSAGARSQGAAPGQRNPETGQRFFCPGGARPQTQVLKNFVDQHRDTYGVEPICKVLQYVAFVIDVYACRIVGWWRVSSSMRERTLFWTRWSRLCMPLSPITMP